MVLRSSEEGLEAEEIAQIVRESHITALCWLKRYLAEGIEGLKDNPRPGRSTMVTEAYRKRLLEAVRRRPRSLGLEYSMWTLQRLSGYLAEETGVRISSETVRRELAKEDIVFSRPQHTIASPDLEYQVKIAPGGPGVGKKTAAKLIADVPELGDCDRKQIAALISVAPYSWESGHKSAQFYIRGGRPDVRSILYMATLTATRCNQVIRKMYQRLLKAGKKKKVAIVACMRKLLTILNALTRDRSHWHLAFSA